MARSARDKLRAVLSIVLPFAAIVVGAQYWLSSRDRAQAATQDLSACYKLASDIRALQLRAQHASLVSRSLADLADIVESAAESAGLTSDSIVRIDPQAARRIGDSEYREQATVVEFLAATAPQLRTLIKGITARDSNLEIRTVRLKSPHNFSGDEPEERWGLEMVLTQRVYAPKSTRP